MYPKSPALTKSVMFVAAATWAVLLFAITLAERCPPIIGEFECPLGTNCKENQCLDKSGTPSSVCDDNIECVEGTVCFEGKCYPITSVKCNRHVLDAENHARSIVSNCGKRGKCLNGQCVLDRCLGVSCSDEEMCRDGKCTKIADTFCLGHADCGPKMLCKTNRCTPKTQDPICSCQPHEICHRGQCVANAQCTAIFCGENKYCVEGQCISAIGQDCREDSCHGGTVCIDGVCAANPCPSRCPADQDCRLGECRLVEGLPCEAECHGQYECIDGRCRRNDCSRKVCQLGEACEGGSCVKVAGRFCTWAPRDCGHAFLCKDNKCVDELQPVAASGQDNEIRVRYLQ